MNTQKQHNCPTCGKKFATRGAMKQHQQQAHKGGNKKSRANPNRSQIGLATNVSTGSDIIWIGGVDNNTKMGTMLYSTTISVPSFKQTRFGGMGSLWARWRPRRLRVEVACSGSYATFGTLRVVWVPEAEYNFVGGRNTVIQSGAMLGTDCRLNQTKSFTIPSESSRKWYEVGGLPDDSSHGRICLIAATTMGGYNGQLTAILHLHWTVEFEGPVMTANPNDLEIISPDASYQDLFTTSDGSFDATILTFKMHAGGDMVPWSSARAGVVYTSAYGTKVHYTDTADKDQECKWFSLLQGYRIPGMLLFATKSDAQAYVASGSLEKALKYHAAGNKTTPSIPRLQAVSSSLSVEEGRADNEVRVLGTVKTADSKMRNLFEAFQKFLAEQAASRPTGALTDPVKVFVEDPVKFPTVSSLDTDWDLASLSLGDPSGTDTGGAKE